MALCSEKWSFGGGVCVKTVTCKGIIGERPKENATCEIIISLESGGHLQCTESEYLKENFSGTVVVGNADCEVDRQVERCVRTMVPNEQCLLAISFKEFPSTVTLSVVLSSFSQFPDIFEWTREEKLAVARQHKQRGVQLFQAGRLSDSFLKFNKAVKLVITVGIEDSEASDLYLQVCNNMAWCHLKQGHTIHALTLCNKVLNVDPSNVKALLRRSEAYNRLNDVKLAVLDLRQVRKLEPNNGVAKERLILLQHKLELENIKYANVIKRMFQ
uniref:BDBT FKBP like N-terminal domain-containing protein n=1 Tax=Cuerna arida TaxID=1464854 RepID=A0A1B6F7G4_9HEMI